MHITHQHPSAPPDQQQRLAQLAALHRACLAAIQRQHSRPPSAPGAANGR